MTHIPPTPVSLSHAVALEHIADLRAEADRERASRVVVRPRRVHLSLTALRVGAARSLAELVAPRGARRGEPCPTC